MHLLRFRSILLMEFNATAVRSRSRIASVFSWVRQLAFDNWAKTILSFRWVGFSTDQPSLPACVRKEKRISRLLYPGDAVHLECPSLAQATNKPTAALAFSWFKDGQRLDTSSGRPLLTVDYGLVLTNVRKKRSRIRKFYYLCFRLRPRTQDVTIA